MYATHLLIRRIEEVCQAIHRKRAYSDPNLPLNPIQTYHRFRSKFTTQSDDIYHPDGEGVFMI